MAEIPASMGLRQEATPDGRINLIGKDDLGNDYVARTTAAASVTDFDVQMLHETDRESYRDRGDGARTFVKSITDSNEKARCAQENDYFEDLVEGALPIARVGLGKQGSTSRFTRKYLQNYDQIDWSKV